jgi:hypothetical protein
MKEIKLLILLLVSFIFIGCGGGSGTSGGGGEISSTIYPDSNTKSLSGYIVDDPILNANIDLLDTNGTVIKTFTSVS